jgi:hypothetical protein
MCHKRRQINGQHHWSSGRAMQIETPMRYNRHDWNETMMSWNVGDDVQQLKCSDMPEENVNWNHHILQYTKSMNHRLQINIYFWRWGEVGSWLERGRRTFWHYRMFSVLISIFKNCLNGTFEIWISQCFNECKLYFKEKIKLNILLIICVLSQKQFKLILF